MNVKTVYISSTYKDLKEHREAVYHALTKMRYHVVAMEDYVARDERTVDACLSDVAQCDFYVGIFARRYGWIPPAEDSPQGKSITELEYRRAREEKKQCLLFLLDPMADWPDDACEDDPEKAELLQELRTELELKSPARFETTSDLVENVMASVHLAEAEVPLGFLYPDLRADDPVQDATGVANVEEELELPRVDLQPAEWETFYVGGIKEKFRTAISKAERTRVIRVNLGIGESWWSTRLHLLAAMLADYTSVAQIAFTGEGWRYLGMCSPADVRRALAGFFPEVERAYLSSLPDRVGPVFDPLAEIDSIVENFAKAMDDSGGEVNVKQWVAPHVLGAWPGFRDERIEIRNSPAELLREIVNRASVFVALVRDERLVRVEDRVALVTRIAQHALR